MKFIVGLICIFFSIKAFPESIYYKVVAQDGSGDYLREFGIRYSL